MHCTSLTLAPALVANHAAVPMMDLIARSTFFLVIYDPPNVDGTH
jgi:hypothetical protein